MPDAASPVPGINPALRRRYDLRGVAGSELTARDARAVGVAFAAMARRRGLSRIAVSRDGRLSSDELERALVRGLRAGGAAVHRLPLGPTPVLSFAIDRLALDGGIMVTGSHNPPGQNGFKLHLAGAPLHGPALGELWRQPPDEPGGGSVVEVDVSEDYLAALVAAAGEAPFCAAWDCGNGATGPLVERLAARLPGRHRVLHAAVDGRFPNHHPDPAVAENLRDLAAAVPEAGCEIGFAFDGDGDRIGVVDGSGAIVWPDQLLLLLAQDVLRDRPDSAIVADVKSSETLFRGIVAADGRPIMAPSGYVLIRERMLLENAPMAGEMSGHVFFRDRWHGADDGLYTAMRVLRALARRGCSLRAFRESLPASAATPEIRLPCPEGRQAEVIEAVAARLDGRAGGLDRTDGIRLTGADGWWLLRASGTEPKVTVRCEAPDPARLRKLIAELAAELRAAGLAPDGLLAHLPP